MAIVSVYNIKGGVGKTASAVNLAYLAAASGMSTLICDLDPQSSATFYFRVKPKIKAGTKSIIQGGKKIDRNIKATDYENLDLLPADLSFRHLDIDLDHEKRSKKRLKDIMQPLDNDYDIVFIDCPPNITLVSENVFNASDLIIVPVIPTTLSCRTYDKLVSFFEKRRLKNKSIIPFFSMVEIRKNMHNNCMDTMRKDYPQFLNTTIPYSSIVEKMGIYREPVMRFQPRSKPGLAYQALWNELATLIRKSEKAKRKRSK